MEAEVLKWALELIHIFLGNDLLLGCSIFGQDL